MGPFNNGQYVFSIEFYILNGYFISKLYGWVHNLNSINIYSFYTLSSIMVTWYLNLILLQHKLLAWADRLPKKFRSISHIGFMIKEQMTFHPKAIGKESWRYLQVTIIEMRLFVSYSGWDETLLQRKMETFSELGIRSEIIRLIHDNWKSRMQISIQSIDAQHQEYNPK
jgi:hypothetical protein